MDSRRYLLPVINDSVIQTALSMRPNSKLGQKNQVFKIYLIEGIGKLARE